MGSLRHYVTEALSELLGRFLPVRRGSLWPDPDPQIATWLVEDGPFGHEGFSVRLFCDDHALGKELVELFDSLRVDDAIGTVQRLEILTQARGRRSRIAALLDGDLVVADPNPGLVVERLLASFDRWVLDASPGPLHLHAGLVAAPGSRGVLVVGGSGAGKSTLVAALTLRGHAYLTDEMVSLPGRGAPADGFRRPLILKPGSSDRFGEYAEVIAEQPWNETWLRPIPPGRLAGGVCDSPIDVTVVAFCVRNDQHEGTFMEVVHPAAAAVQLVEYCFDAARQTGYLETLCVMAASAHCIRVHYRDALDVVPRLSAWASHPIDPAPVIPVGATVSSRGPRRATDVESVIVGTGVVARDQRTKEVVALAGLPPALWQALDGTLSEADLVAWSAEEPGLAKDPGGRTIRRALSTLIQAGLVER